MEEFNHYLPGLMLAFGAYIAGFISPGPNILTVIGTSMSFGRESGKALALGVASGSFLWGLITWFGLTTILTLYASVLTAIKLFGAAYLLWLAYRAFRSAATAQESEIRQLRLANGPGAYYRRGLLVQMTNPKAALWWVAVMALGVDAQAPLWVGATIVIGATLISVIGHLIYAVAFSTTPMVTAYRRARRWIDGGLGVFFCYASFKLLSFRS